MRSIFITSLFLLSLILLPSSSCTQKKVFHFPTFAASFFIYFSCYVIFLYVDSDVKHHFRLSQVYVVNFRDHRGDKAPAEIEDFHKSYLLSVKETEEEAKTSLLYSYKHSINGFAALLTPEEASKLSGKK